MLVRSASTTADAFSTVTLSRASRSICEPRAFDRSSSANKARDVRSFAVVVVVAIDCSGDGDYSGWDGALLERTNDAGEINAAREVFPHGQHVFAIRATASRDPEMILRRRDSRAFVPLDRILGEHEHPVTRLADAVDIIDREAARLQRLRVQSSPPIVALEPRLF